MHWGVGKSVPPVSTMLGTHGRCAGARSRLSHWSHEGELHPRALSMLSGSACQGAPMACQGLTTECGRANVLQFHLPPLPSPSRRRQSPTPTTKLAYQAHLEDQAKLDKALAKRRRIYDRDLWYMHIPSNKWTKYTNISPYDFRSSSEVGNGESSSDPASSESETARRARSFLTRELQLFPQVDPQATTTQLINLFKVVDLRSVIAGNLLHDLIGIEGNRVLHELYSFLRSPFELEDWDDINQYGADECPRGRTVSRSPPPEAESRGRSRSRSRTWSRSRSRSRSWSRSPSRDRWSRDQSRSVSADRDRRRRGDQFVPPALSGERRWDKSDSWVDPEFARPRRRRRGGKREREREARREAAKERDRTGVEQPHINPALAGATGDLSIKGSAERRQSLLERLAKLKSQEVAGALQQRVVVVDTSKTESNTSSPQNEEDKAAQLREKLIAERKRKVLREQLLARKKAKTEARTENNGVTIAAAPPQPTSIAEST